MRTALRMSRTYTPTLKEVPAEAEVASHRILLRAGMIRKVAAGVYTFLPLGWRALRKVENVVREEMDRAGAQEILMPAVQPGELWLESGRWDVYGPELMRLKDRHGRDFALGPTHEELVTSLVRHELRSYRDLPVTLYQIQVKFRDEVRPRFGLLRAREFIMKDAYSFHADQASLEETYETMSRAYGRICERLGLVYRPVEAESGQIGGKVTTEFMALAENGEAALVYCDGCDWAANVEAAEAVVPPSPAPAAPVEMERVETPGKHTIGEVSEFLGVGPVDVVKTMVGQADGRLVLFLLPGDRDLNPVKAGREVPGVRLLAEEEIEARGLPVGSLGPVGAPEGALVIGDRSLAEETHWVVGANEEGFHLRHALPGRDFQVERWEDLVFARPGDLCPACAGELREARGIEVSQVFQLGIKYSEAMGATFTAEDGTEQPFVMGCYGVGISRSLAAVIEQYADDAGVAWPVSVAPLEVTVLPLSSDEEVMRTAEELWTELSLESAEVMFDDRDERAGVKFADADLIGFPYQVIVGKRGLAEGTVELKERFTGERTQLPLAEAVDRVMDALAEARARYR